MSQESSYSCYLHLFFQNHSILQHFWRLGFVSCAVAFLLDLPGPPPEYHNWHQGFLPGHKILSHGRMFLCKKPPLCSSIYFFHLPSPKSIFRILNQNVQGNLSFKICTTKCSMHPPHAVPMHPINLRLFIIGLRSVRYAA